MSARRPQYRISYIVRGDEAPEPHHTTGINSLALDLSTPTESDGHPGGILYTAGRDSIVNSWEVHVDYQRRLDQLDAAENAALNRRLSFTSTRPTGRLSKTSHVPYAAFGEGSYGPGKEMLMFGEMDSPSEGRADFDSERGDETTTSRGEEGSAALERNGRQLGGVRTRVESENARSIQNSPGTGVSAGLQYRKPQASDAGAPRSSSSTSEMIDSVHIYSSSPPSGLASSVTAQDMRKARSVTFNQHAQLQGNTARQSMYRKPPMEPEEIEAFNKASRHEVPATTHRLSFQYHSDWVTDMALVNQNQHFVTASADRTVQLWSAHYHYNPHRIGYHSDYVRCLAYARKAGWVASAGLDRRIFLWDLGEGKGENGAFLINDYGQVLMNEASPDLSVYALACNASGTILVSGSPEKVIRVFDPRSGKLIMRLTGHTDNIRSLLVSDDGRTILSASSDTTIKLWSLSSPQRCLVTYTHNNDSVWSLTSNHPQLETFWAGGRDGLVTKMSRRRLVGQDGSGGFASADDELVDCVALCKETSGVNALVAIDDLYVWTATASSSVNRWRDVPFRCTTVLLPRANSYFADLNLSPAPPAATTSSNAIVDSPLSSSPVALQSPLGSTPRQRPPTTLALSQSLNALASTLNFGASFHSINAGTDHADIVIPPASIIKQPYVALRALLARRPPVQLPNSPPPVPPAPVRAPHTQNSTDNVSFRSHAGRFSVLSVDGLSLTPTTWGVHGLTLTGGGIPEFGDFDENGEGLDEDEFDDDGGGSNVEPVWKEPDEVIPGRPGLARSFILNDRRKVLTMDESGIVCVWDVIQCRLLKKYTPPPSENRESSTAELKLRNEILFQRVIDEWNTAESVANWCTVDIKNGLLTVHIDEGKAFDSEAYLEELDLGVRPQNEDQRVNLGRWVLTYLFLYFGAAMHGYILHTPPNQNTHAVTADSTAQSHGENHGDHLAANNDSCSGSGEKPTNLRGESIESKVNHLDRSDSARRPAPKLSIPPPPSQPPPRSLSISAKQPPQKTPVETHTTRENAPLYSSDPLPVQTLIANDNADNEGAKDPKDIGGAGSRNLETRIESPKFSPTKENGYHDSLMPESKNEGEPSRSSNPVEKSEELQQTPKLVNGTLGVRDALLPAGPSSLGTPSPLGVSLGSGSSSEGSQSAESSALDISSPQVAAAHTRDPPLESTDPPLSEINLPPVTQASAIPAFLNLEETPWVQLPPDLAVAISVEESPEAAAFMDIYRGSVLGMGWQPEVAKIQKILPQWAYEWIAEDKPAPRDTSKMSFMLLAHPGSELRELPNGNSRLSANRMLRVRKLIAYVVERLELSPPLSVHKALALAGIIPGYEVPKSPSSPQLVPGATGTGIYESFNNVGEPEKGPTIVIKPEMWMELVCCDKPVHHKTTLATLRHQVWKGGGDLVLTYRPVPLNRLATAAMSVLNNTAPPSHFPRGKPI
ncbi:hypothetical protein BJ742DRAFT_40981 [Cladochytrium replicatum]|nr:hypothetical protein BJ742DRAFT_40981 [Cladochytrium replicatum]